MKKLFTLLLITSSLLIVSCSRCYRCTCDGDDTEKICRSEFDTNEDFNEYVADEISDGCVCRRTMY
jgi:hypothetical protein